MTDNRRARIEASRRFVRRQHEVMDEDARADQPDLLQPDDDASARRRELEHDLAMRGGLTDPRLRELAFEKLGAAALSDEALELLDELLKVLTRGSDGQA